jgi:hypothetical protein
MAEPDVARFEALLTSRGRELLDRIATEAIGLGERALICSGASDFTQIPQAEHVKVVGAVNHTAVFPACRAIVPPKASPRPPISRKTPPARDAVTDRRRRTAWAPVTTLNRMPLDSQAHRMPQGPLSRSPRNGPADERRVERYRHGQYTRLDG